jgi:integrase
MASLFKSKTIAYYLKRRRVPKGTPHARKRVIISKNWYGRYKDADGKRRSVPLCPDKKASQEMLAKRIIDARQEEIGLGDPYAEHRRLAIGLHFYHWEQSLRAAGHSEKQIKLVAGRVARVIKTCGFKVFGDIDPARVQQFLAGLRVERRPVPPLPELKEFYTRREAAICLLLAPGSVTDSVRRYGLPTVQTDQGRRYPKETIVELRRILIGDGLSIQTQNFYLNAMKQFCRWMVQNRRTDTNPLAHLAGGNVKLDRRHDRRPLSEEQLQSLLSATSASKMVFRGLTGPDRAMIYFTAMATGLRAAELGSLAPRNFDLGVSPPVVYVKPGYVKNRQEVTQPLTPELAKALGAYLAHRPSNELLWPGTWYRAAAKALKIDLEAAGIPYVIQGPFGPLYADFHALRHSFIALLDRAGVTVKQAMQLARHSDPRLTMARYGRAQLCDLGAAVEALPALMPADFVRTRFVHPEVVSGRNRSQGTETTRSQKGAKASGKQAEKRKVS